MALTKAMTMQAYGQDVTVPDAYIEVTAVNVTKSNANAFVCVFAADRTTVISKSQYMFVPSLANGSPDIITQAYDYLKTLAEFAGAVDAADAA
ncbi:hypothetical protein [Burkholderia gladioli]|uniref:hypothetical protein n=1 Tax=Burkholderia gladioli TaxID=28095 RepID=UPI001C2537DE|nr:hypothetical protein [Burkholderia gladioli]MBU9378698.1 hypothetical protein [Burkholderia gladioli]